MARQQLGHAAWLESLLADAHAARERLVHVEEQMPLLPGYWVARKQLDHAAGLLLQVGSACEAAAAAAGWAQQSLLPVH